MDLKIKDVSELLNVSETTIRRWLSDGKIPAYRINHQYRFNREEIENWVLSHKLGKGESISPYQAKRTSAATSSGGGVKQYSLFRALHHGDVLKDIPGDTKEDVIGNTMSSVAKTLQLDAGVLKDFLLDRENQMPTALGCGVGVPHTRDFLLDEHFDVVTIVYPKKPIEYGALDGKPVDLLFFLFACEDKRHLNLLAKIAHLCSDPETLQFIKSRPNKEKLLEFIQEWESNHSL